MIPVMVMMMMMMKMVDYSLLMVTLVEMKAILAPTQANNDPTSLPTDNRRHVSLCPSLLILDITSSKVLQCLIGAEEGQAAHLLLGRLSTGNGGQQTTLQGEGGAGGVAVSQ